MTNLWELDAIDDDGDYDGDYLESDEKLKLEEDEEDDSWDEEDDLETA